ncbi:MAG: SMP-30/gluconolactonase/LRE family protein [Noviherbaspirillum sp.]|nr:SMP-30/gluconolactonase/LRE family protein [Noviherbaspirillum sp.]MDB5794313.1 SMP-30/gluconolactonase/LRE family protein [Noviherbaspirillum sp.]
MSTSISAEGEVQVLFDTPMQVGETPLWHPDEAALYWVDIAGRAVHRHTPASGMHTSWALPSEPGCIARSAGGKMIVAMRSGLSLLDTNSGALVPIADAPYDPRVARFNDGRCDAAGRLWAGTMYEPRDKPAGSLYCIEHNAIRDAGKPVTVSNGLAFSIDNRTMYHADTTAHRITAYDFDLATASIGEGRLFKQFSTDRSHDYGGRPDGAAVDSEDAYWCAMYEGGRILRLSPTGEVLREIALPVRCPTMVAFGGPDFRTLYVTSARHNRPDAELAQYPLSGCVLAIRVDVPGRPEPAYQPLQS